MMSFKYYVSFLKIYIYIKKTNTKLFFRDNLDLLAIWNYLLIMLFHNQNFYLLIIKINTLSENITITIILILK